MRSGAESGSATPIERVLAELTARACSPRRAGAAWSAKCPAHEDRAPSLSISKGDDGRALVNCHAGCDFDAILAVLSLKSSDLYPAKEHTTPLPRRIVAKYDYRDETGALLFQAVRYDPKGFRQRRPNGNGGWSWKLDDVRRVPYRLPELLEAVANGQAVYICEGERDVGTLVGLGLVATCNPMGAGKWRADFAQHFVGADVVVVTDRDPAGYKHAADVVRSLEPVAASVRIVEAVEGKDTTDHFYAGFTLDELVPVDLAEKLADQPPGDDKTETAKRSQAAQLVDLAIERYDLGQSPSGDPFGVRRDGPRVVRMLRGGRHSLRAELAALYREAFGSPPSQNALAAAMLVLEGLSADSIVDLHVRVAESEDTLVLDLGRPDGHAVVIDRDGYRVVEQAPVLFRRSELTGPLPDPTSGGTVEELRFALHLAEQSADLALAFLVAALFPNIPHPIAALFAEQGQGKSTTAKRASGLIDPSAAQLRAVPRDLEGWAVSASASWVVALDNLSTIPQWLSDALCRSATGDGLVRRLLYTSEGLSVLAFKRVIMLTAIDAGSLRGDLADRILLLNLERLDGRSRRTDSDLDAEWRELHPKLLGVVLATASKVLAILDTITLDDVPRMADFATIAAAIDRVTGSNALAAYRAQGPTVAEDVVEGDPLAEAVRTFTEDHHEWEGELKDLLEQLTVPDPRPRSWPNSTKQLGGALRRVAPALRMVGTAIDLNRRHPEHRRRLVSLAATRGREDSPERSDAPDPPDSEASGGSNAPGQLFSSDLLAACAGCGSATVRLIPHYATGEPYCPACCQELYPREEVAP